MEWLVRPRPSGWPSSELVQEIFDSGCHLAPVGRRKRVGEPVAVFHYCRNLLEATLASSSVLRKLFGSTEDIMDETEWPISFSLAENKLGESVSPVQRHVMVLLKIIKKFYFPEEISTYYLKNLLFWECEKKGDEDPSRLQEAAVQVAEVRCNILSKTLNLLRKLQSLTFQSQIYLKNVGLLLEKHLSKMEDKTLSEEDRKQLSRAIRSVFVGKCKDVIASIQRLSSTEGLNRGTQSLINVSLYAYQSNVARNLCTFWFLDSSKSNDEKVLEVEEFKTYVRQEVQDLSLDNLFYEVVNVFSKSVRKGAELSSAIPTTIMMEKLRKKHIKEAHEQEENARAQLKGVLDFLKTSDMKLIEKKVTKKFKERGEGFFPTEEEIKKAINEELTALFRERMKGKE